MLMLKFLTDYVQPTRNFSLAYLLIDSVLLCLFVVLLFLKKKKVTAYWALCGGVLYWLVDYGYFYLISQSRQITFTINEVTTVCTSLETALVLLWMSMSYGILDFAFIWLWLNKDKHAKEFTALIVIYWCCIPLIATIFDNSIPSMIYIETTRSTGKYHGVMGLIMLVGYVMLIIKNLFAKTKEDKAPILRLFIIGFMAQFLWEFFLLVFNIRSQNYDSDMARQLSTLLQNSLVETNLGMPYIYLINKAVTKRWNDDKSPVRSLNSDLTDNLSIEK